MSDAGNDISIEAPAAVEAAAETPKGKFSAEDALQVGKNTYQSQFHC
jgi:small subunit ribosomal protein S12e